MTNIVFALMPLFMGAIVCIIFYFFDQTRFAVRGVAGPYFAALALLFGLFGSLIAGEEWQKVARANSLIQNEVSALRSVARISEAVKADDKVKPLIADYVTEARAKEASFFKSGRPESLAPQPLRAIQSLFKIAADEEYWRNRDALSMAFVDAIEKARGSWLERQELRKSHVLVGKFVIMFFLGFLTQVSIALCHGGNQRAVVATVMLFSLGFAATAATLVLFDDPYGASHLINDAVLGDVT